MTTQLQDFVSTYRRPHIPEPFFGFFKVGPNKHDRTPMYLKINRLIEKGYDRDEISIELHLTRRQIRYSIKYLKDKIKNI